MPAGSFGVAWLLDRSLLNHTPFMTTTFQDSLRVQALLSRGVILPCPGSVEVGDDVDPQRIAPGVVIHAGCKIFGRTTSMGPGCVIGKEAPATVEDCQLAQRVLLKGGYFSGATFLAGSAMGSAAHIRPGTLLEEESGGAHAVGLKQTIFLPFVTAGSLINLCDCLMAGGTSRKDHSEIGSSYVHFNFTPHGDKATASLIGDVPRGVMLDQPAVFLGGQGGVVGPARIGFGVVIPAGVICREDVEDGLLFQPETRMGHTKPYQLGAYRDISRVIVNGLNYIGNLRALQAWYANVRNAFMASDVYERACYEGALDRLDSVVEERVRRLKELAGKMPRSLEYARAHPAKAKASWCAVQQRFLEQWPEMESKLNVAPGPDVGARERDILLNEIAMVSKGKTYLESIQTLSSDAKKAGSAWLRAIVSFVSCTWDRRS